MNIKGGATIWARQTIESEIFYDKPDKWFKIWFYIVNRVNHKQNKKWERGQCHITYSEIQSNTKATKAQIDHCVRYLKKEQMLATQKATRGMHITVIKYNIYQDLDNYKSDTKSELEATQKRHRSDTINKNDKNDKNEKNTSKTSFADKNSILISQVNKQECGFDLFWEKYPKKINKTTAIKSFNKIKPDEKLLETILKSIDNLKETKDWKKDDGQFIPYPATWLNNKRWEDEITTKPKTTKYDHLTKVIKK